MTITFRKCFLSLTCLASAMLITSCGGSGAGDDGYAPSTLDGLTLQLIPGSPSSGVSPGMVNINASSASMGYVNNGTTYSAQVVYSKTGPDNATVSLSMHTPEVGTPTTVTFTLSAEMTFNEDGKTGTMQKWNFVRHTAGSAGGSAVVGQGESGSVVCIAVN